MSRGRCGRVIELDYYDGVTVALIEWVADVGAAEWFLVVREEQSRAKSTVVSLGWSIVLTVPPKVGDDRIEVGIDVDTWEALRANEVWGPPRWFQVRGWSFDDVTCLDDRPGATTDVTPARVLARLQG
jgi:hypothetical protein